MHQLLINFIKNNKTKTQKSKEEGKAVRLISLGLYERLYCPTEGSVHEGEDFPYYDNKEDRYYKIEPIAISDEDFEELFEYSPLSEIEMFFNNVIAKIFLFIGIITMIVGFFLGIYVAGEVSGILGIATTIYGIVPGFLFLGFAETIKLLTGIKNK